MFDGRGLEGPREFVESLGAFCDAFDAFNFVTEFLKRRGALSTRGTFSSMLCELVECRNYTSSTASTIRKHLKRVLLKLYYGPGKLDLFKSVYNIDSLK